VPRGDRDPAPHSVGQPECHGRTRRTPSRASHGHSLRLRLDRSSRPSAPVTTATSRASLPESLARWHRDGVRRAAGRQPEPGGPVRYSPGPQAQAPVVVAGDWVRPPRTARDARGTDDDQSSSVRASGFGLGRASEPDGLGPASGGVTVIILAYCGNCGRHGTGSCQADDHDQWQTIRRMIIMACRVMIQCHDHHASGPMIGGALGRFITGMMGMMIRHRAG
jgi:hypothetical protein